MPSADFASSRRKLEGNDRSLDVLAGSLLRVFSRLEENAETLARLSEQLAQLERPPPKTPETATTAKPKLGISPLGGLEPVPQPPGPKRPRGRPAKLPDDADLTHAGKTETRGDRCAGPPAQPPVADSLVSH
jgi:hypothetical protein